MIADPTYGYNLERLLTVPAPEGPADFAAFWQTTYQESRAVETRPTRKRIESDLPGVEVYKVYFGSIQGVRIGGWMTVPADGVFARGVVVGHGYGGREGPDLQVPGPPAVVIFPCARGFNLSAHPSIPDEMMGHVLHGIGHREDYSHRGCVADLWGAASVLLEWFPQVAGALHYCGGSFGGGIGALALPWDSRFSQAYLDVPTFGNHPLRVTLPCEGSGEAVQRYYHKYPEVLDTLAYFDSATAARFIHKPVYVAAALADPRVPPPGQFAVYNALAGSKGLYIREGGHPNTPADDAAVNMQTDRWFGKA